MHYRRSSFYFIFLTLGTIALQSADAGNASPRDSARCSMARSRVEEALPDFILGVQAAGTDTTLQHLSTMGVSWARTYVAWNSIQPVIYDDAITMEDVVNHPEWIDDLLENGEWDATDASMRALSDGGLRLIPIIGAGWYNSYALIEGEDATPDRLGQEAYIAYMYVHVAAVVERYDGDGDRDAEGIQVDAWQIENELNQAWFTAIWGWRKPQYEEGWNSEWRDFDFLTRLLQTLDEAVHASDNDAITIQNIHTDVPAVYNHFFGQPSWEDSAYLWRDVIDVMGFDAYPNYYYADPINGEVVGERAQILQQQSGLPVILMEVGYPAGPAELGYTPEKQAEFIREAFDSLYATGSIGYFHFKLQSSYTNSVEITEEDKFLLSMVGHLFENERVLPLLFWAVKNIDYIEDHFLDVLQSVEPFWGLIDEQEQQMPSYFMIQQIASELAPDATEAARPTLPATQPAPPGMHAPRRLSPPSRILAIPTGSKP